MIKTCKYCNKEFETGRHKHVVYCSHKCANAGTAKTRERRIIIVCEYCKKEFEVTPGDLKYRIIIRFCSNECKAKGQFLDKRIIKNCDNCGKPIETLKVRMLHREETFCSVACKNSGYLKNHPSKSMNWNQRIAEAMATEEIKNKLRTLNSRSRKPMTDEHKNKISDKLFGIMPANSKVNQYTKYKRGTYNINGKDIFFRSKWEANYALYLDFLIKVNQVKSWCYEPRIFYFESIRRGSRSYTPDFKVELPEGGYEWHEVKGYMNPQSKTKLKRMSLYYPKEKIVLIERIKYSDILKKLTGVINFY